MLSKCSGSPAELSFKCMRIPRAGPGPGPGPEWPPDLRSINSESYLSLFLSVTFVTLGLFSLCVSQLGRRERGRARNLGAGPGSNGVFHMTPFFTATG